MKTLQELFYELLEIKQPDFTIKIIKQKDTRKAFDLLRKNKVKFTDESSDLFVFKKEKDWEEAMDILDDNNIEIEIEG